MQFDLCPLLFKTLGNYQKHFKSVISELNNIFETGSI